MRLFCAHTAGYAPLAELLVQSLHGLDLQPELQLLDGESGGPGTAEYSAVAAAAARARAEFVAAHPGETAVLADADVQFFADRLPRDLGELDLLGLASQAVPGAINSGLLVVRCSPTTALFQTLGRTTANSTDRALNNQLQAGVVRYALLPPHSYRCAPMSTLPPGLVAHHAAYVRGVNNKLAEMARVRGL